jgi:hypothetical protein
MSQVLQSYIANVFEIHNNNKTISTNNQKKTFKIIIIDVVSFKIMIDTYKVENFRSLFIIVF